jgi:hypothetical protein
MGDGAWSRFDVESMAAKRGKKEKHSSTLLALLLFLSLSVSRARHEERAQARERALDAEKSGREREHRASEKVALSPSSFFSSSFVL